MQSANLDALFIVKDANQKVVKDGAVANPVYGSAMVSFVANFVSLSTKTLEMTLRNPVAVLHPHSDLRQKVIEDLVLFQI